jgi:hypothetical protein
MNTVKRYKLKDKVSVYHRPIFYRMRTLWLLTRKGVIYGDNYIVKADVDLMLTDNTVF